MGVSYKDRLEGGYQFVRIRKFKAWTAAGLILATSGLVAVSLAEGGATARPLYFPVEAFLPALLVMFLIGLILEMFFRTLSIKYAKKDGQRYLMVQGSISRAKLTIAICIIVAVILLAPATRGAMDASASPPTTRYSLVGNAQWTFRFDNQDGLGISRYNTFVVTLLTSSGKLRVEVVRGTTNQAWFIAFAPVDNPKVAIAVTVERTSGQGGTVAAPIAKRVLEALARG